MHPCIGYMVSAWHGSVMFFVIIEARFVPGQVYITAYTKKSDLCIN